MFSKLLFQTVRTVILLAISTALSSCFAITDLDRFEVSPDFNLTFADLEADDRLVEFRIITDEARPQFLARGVIDLYQQDDQPFTIKFFNLIPAGTQPIVELYIDENDDGMYTDAEDIAYRQTGQGGELSFSQGQATDIDYNDTPLVSPTMPVDLTLMGFDGPHLDDLFELKVVRTSDDRTVGYYRTVGLETETQVFIPEVFNDPALYHLEFYADKNANCRYDDPSDDHAWRLDSAAIVNFSHDTNWVPLPSFQLANPPPDCL